MEARKPSDGLERAVNALNSTFLWANRVLDTVKESVWIDFGLPFTSEFIHELAHINLERLDTFGDYLHENFIRQSYPETPALVEPIEDMDKVFEIVVGIIDEVDEAILAVIEAAGGGVYNALALASENIQQANSTDRTKVLQAWKMWSNKPSYTSFDNWMEHLTSSEAVSYDD
jgi:hypothetical protein